MCKKDLRVVWDEVDPAFGMQQMGQRLRDDAKTLVEGFGESNADYMIK